MWAYFNYFLIHYNILCIVYNHRQITGNAVLRLQYLQMLNYIMSTAKKIIWIYSPALILTLCPVRSKQSEVKWFEQTRECMVALNSLRFMACSHFLTRSGFDHGKLLHTNKISLVEVDWLHVTFNNNYYHTSSRNVSSSKSFYTQCGSTYNSTAHLKCRWSNH